MQQLLLVFSPAKHPALPPRSPDLIAAVCQAPQQLLLVLAGAPSVLLAAGSEAAAAVLALVVVLLQRL
jgi:hypothetical protein